MSKRQLTLELEQSICEHDLTPDRLTLDMLTLDGLTLDQLTEWDLQFTGEFSKDMYTRVRENARSMYVLMREILPIFDLLVEKGERLEKPELPEPYISRIHERLKYFLRDCLTDARTALKTAPKTNAEKILPRS